MSCIKCLSGNLKTVMCAFKETAERTFKLAMVVESEHLHDKNIKLFQI